MTFPFLISERTAHFTRYPVCAGQRHACHGRGLDREGDEVLPLESMHAAFPARPRDCLRLDRERRGIISEPPAAKQWIEARGKHWVLRRDARRVASFMPIVIAAGRAGGPGVIF